MVGVVTGVMFMLMFAVYFVPTVVASVRRTKVLPVFLINLFLGWSMIGWVGALVLASLAPSERDQHRLANQAHFGRGVIPGQGYPLGPGMSHGPMMPPGQQIPHADQFGFPQQFPGQFQPGFPPQTPPQPQPGFPQETGASDLPYGGFGSTPYGYPGSESGQYGGTDPFGRAPRDENPDEDPYGQKS